MREIIFRGKRMDNGEWIRGDLITSAGHPDRAWITECKTLFDRQMQDIGIREVDKSTVGQYTDLTDKNGKKIFEGDIVKTKYGRLCTVVWFAPKLCFDLEPINKPENLSSKAPDKWDLWHSENLEVVGNVYDKPELLEEEEYL